MTRRLLTIVMLAIFMASITLPAASALAVGVENVVRPTVTTIPAPENAPYNIENPYLNKIDKAILDPDYVRQLADAYSYVYGQSYATLMNNPGARAKFLGILVKLSDLSVLDEVEQVVSKYNGKVVKVYPYFKSALIALPVDYGYIYKAAYSLARLPGVEKVELDKLASPAMWDSVVLLNVAQLHNMGYNGSGVLVAILDTGVDPTHPAIPDPVYWADFINGQPTPYDDHGHGTHVAGTALGRGPSLFNTTTGMWHNVLVGDVGNFNNVDKANLTYTVNVTALAGQNVTLEINHLYNLYHELYLPDLNWTVYFLAYAYIFYKIDNGSWILLANFSAMNQTIPIIDKFNISIPAGAQNLSISFVVDYVAYIDPVARATYVSHHVINGWFIDYVKIYNAANASQVILFDDVATSSPPPEVSEASWWIRTPSNFTGMAPAADLAAAKVCAAGAGCPTSAILAGMEWAYNISADIVSMSLGGPAIYYDILAQAADWLVQQGIVVTIAAGNSGPDYFTVESPGISKLAITVAAATKAWTVGYFSSSGPSPVDFSVKPDIAAPGRDISSSVPLALATFPDFPYEAWDGTSMATPHVAGIAALILQAHPNWTPIDVKNALISTADWLYPDAYGAMIRPYDIYKQGGGMVDPVEAINTAVIPYNASISFGNPYLLAVDYLEKNITLKNLVNVNITANVTNIDAYVILNPEASWPDYLYLDVPEIISSPKIGDIITIPANGTANLTLQINLTNKTLPRGVYGGHVELTLSNGQVIHVIFGFFLRVPVPLNGTVYDYNTMMPAANVLVRVYSANLSVIYNETVTDVNGSYSVIVPSDTDVRIVVFPNLTVYYLHASYAFNTGPVGTVYDAFLVERVTQPTVFIVRDMFSAPNVTDSLEAFENASEKLGVPYLVWYPELFGTLYGPLSSGDFPVVVYLAGGWYFPLFDILDYYSVIYFANYTPGLIVLSGGDIGWFHEDDDLMQYVAHAVFYADLWPGDYNVTLLKTDVTATLLGTGKLAEYFWAPEGTPIGDVLIHYIEGYWPDVVTPVNGGYSAAAYNFSGYLVGSAIVLYDGSGAQAAKSVYYAFDFEMLPPELLEKAAVRTLLYYYDTQAPIANVTAAEFTVDGYYIMVNVTGQFTDDYEVRYYYYEIWNENETELEAYGAFEKPVFTLDLSSLGLESGKAYKLKIWAADIPGRPSIGYVEAAFRYLPTASGSTLVFNINTTLPVEGVAQGAWVAANVTGQTTVQLIQVPNVTVLGVSEPSTVFHTWRLHLDLYSPNAAANAQQIVVKIKIPTRLAIPNPDKLKVLYFDGSGWKAATNATVDPETGIVTIAIGPTTQPSLADLNGTPIIVSLPARIVGGELTTLASNNGTPLALLAVGLALALSGIARRSAKA